MPNREGRTFPASVDILLQVSYSSLLTTFFSPFLPKKVSAPFSFSGANFVKKFSLWKGRRMEKRQKERKRSIEDYKVSLSLFLSLSLSLGQPASQPPSSRYILQPRSFHLFTGQTHFRRWVINGARARLIKFLRVVGLPWKASAVPFYL